MKSSFYRRLAARMGIGVAEAAPAKAPALPSVNYSFKHHAVGVSAAATLPTVPLPDAPKKQASLPGYRTQADRSDDLLRRVTRVTPNTDPTTFRTGTNPSQLIRNFLESSPDMSATLSAYLRTGIPKTYKLTAHDLDGSINPEATRLVHELLARITFLSDPTLGYNPTTDLQSLSESLGRELLLDGAMAVELVLDEMGVPSYPAPVAVSTLQFKEDKARGVIPVQVVAGEEIELDIPTVFYVSADQDLTTPYAISFFAVAVRSVLADEIFNNFLMRQLRRNIAPRMVAKIVEEKVKASVAPDVLTNPTKMQNYMDGLMGAIEAQLEELEPEDAIVSTDMVEYETKTPGGGNGSSGVGTLLEKVRSILTDRVTAALKSLPAVLGRDTSSGSATTSTYLFLKSADIIATKLSTLYSRMLTVAVRLLGKDCYVKFVYDPLDIRPKAEQEAYRAMQQSNTLNLLSWGFLTDVEASIELTGNLPPAGFKPLSGTRFMQNSPQVQDTTSQTSLMNGQKDALKSDAPTKPKGGN